MQCQKNAIEEIQRGARSAAKRHLDQNSSTSVEDVTQDVILELLPKLDALKHPRAVAYLAAKRRCFKINVKRRKHAAAMQEYKTDLEAQQRSLCNQSNESFEELGRVFELKKQTALTLLMRVAIGGSFDSLKVQLDTMMGIARCPNFYRMKFGNGISVLRSDRTIGQE